MKKLFVFLTLLIVVPFFSVSVAFAQDSATGTILESGKVTQGDYFAANENVQVLGTVNGDVFVAGGTVIINGVVNGDVIAAGGTVIVGGIVTGNIRVAGNDVSIMGNINKNATVAGSTVNWSPEAKVGGSVLAFSNNTTLSGRVGKDVKIFGNSITLSEAAVGGSLTYWSSREALITNGSTVTGENTHNKSQAKEKAEEGAEQAGRFFSAATTFGSFVTTLFIGLLLIRFIPRYVGRAEEILHKEFGKSLVRGFIGLSVIPVILIILFVTLIGIPLGFMLTLAFGVYLYVARIFAIIAIGAAVIRFMKNKEGLTKSLFVGLLVYYVLSLIPVIGFIVKTVVSIAALGAALSNDRRTWAMAKSSRLI